jgi:ATP-dependent DNA helicase RecG
MHGRLKQNEKDAVMESFRTGTSDILVTTTVIEVGVDVPNASVIVIHHAERFGLAQLHQLRGRVGRGEHQSFCVLVHPDNVSAVSLERIKTMTETDDGFIIAEKDLHLRGDGQLTGTRQHGHSGFEFMDPGTDMDLILAARKEAALVTERVSDPELEMTSPGKSSGLHSLTGLRTGRILAMLS